MNGGIKKRCAMIAALLAAAGCIILAVYFSEKEDAAVLRDEKSPFFVSHLKTCYLENPIGIDEETPVFSWRMEGAERGICQSAYRIVIAKTGQELAQGQFFWDSGRVSGSESVDIAYSGDKNLTPKTRYYWQVTVWDENDRSSVSVETAYFETGLMGEGMQDAAWITVPEAEHETATDTEPDYTINYDMTVTGAEASFVFGAREGRYGDMYLCRIHNDEEHAAFAFLTMSGGRILSSDDREETDITGCKRDGDDTFAVQLQVRHGRMTVAVNGTGVGTFEIGNVPVAAVGYYMSRGSSYAYLDNLLVTDRTGGILYQDDFEDDDTVFSPYYVPVENGCLKIGSSLMLTAYPDYMGDAAPLFYREFALEDKAVESARVYMTALGSFELICNGQKASEDYFAPGKEGYRGELTYMTYDVTPFLKSGADNALGVTLLHGWHGRAAGYPEIGTVQNDQSALMGMLEVHYRDGSVETIVTDEDFWCTARSPVLEDDIYHGEFYDATLEQDRFGVPGLSLENWVHAETGKVEEQYLTLPLKGKENEPIQCVEELTPVSVSEPEKNVYVYDFGQNFAGTVRIKVRGERGQVLTLRYGETLNTDSMCNKDDLTGTVWTENLLTAEATDYYVMKGDAEGEYFEPSYTYHGFRYLQITGLDEPVVPEDITGIVLSSDLEQTGSFECSNELLNGYFQNTVWSQRSNFMDNPTDCAQRDERHGWAGDAQIISLAASYNMNTYAFYRKYLEELRALQTPEGAFTDIAPANLGGIGNNCWGDAAVVITWNLYTQYGSRNIITENYEALCRWMDYLVKTSDGFIRYHESYGDHLSFEDTPAELSDTAWCAHSADLLSRMAAVLGRTEDEQRYRQIYENYKTAWQNAFVTEQGITVCDTQTSYALGLAFDLFTKDTKAAAAERLDLLAQYSDYHIKTGYSGIAYILPALADAGLTGTAYAYLLQESGPSLLALVRQGATTNYESLNVYRENEDGTYSISGSMNHNAYGAPVSWIYTGILGIRSDENDPAYHHILLCPEPDAALTYAAGRYESVYGNIKVEWQQENNGYSFAVSIPANTTAELELPIPEEGAVYQESGRAVQGAEGVEYLGVDQARGKMKYRIVSGDYFFAPQ